MLTTTTTLLTAGLLAARARAAPFSSTSQPAGVLAFEVTAHDSPNTRVHNRQINEAIKNGGGSYTIDATIGTPGQKVSVQVDTGSTELWVNPICSKSADVNYCSTMGSFDVNQGNPKPVLLGTNSSIHYGQDGAAFVDFEYVTDTLTLGASAKIDKQQFGVGTDSGTLFVGILGLAPPQSGWENSFPLPIDNLRDQGSISSRAFSLDLRAQGSTQGSLIFGGLDTKKFAGTLEKLPVVPAAKAPGGVTRWWVNLEGISINRGGNTTNLQFSAPQAVMPDSGSTLSQLPPAIFQPLIKQFPEATLQPNGQWSLPCPVKDEPGSVDFTLGSTVIKVPYSDFIWFDGGSTCYVGAVEASNIPILGDSFMRAAYLVYDWDNRNVHIASTADCGTNLVAIGNGTDAVSTTKSDC